MAYAEVRPSKVYSGARAAKLLPFVTGVRKAPRIAND
jgi:hypothetical protein